MKTGSPAMKPGTAVAGQQGGRPMAGQRDTALAAPVVHARKTQPRTHTPDNSHRHTHNITKCTFSSCFAMRTRALAAARAAYSKCFGPISPSSHLAG
eukprot:scaffold320725_cov28-Tisochrysis_lutea.AAC.1